MMSKKGSHYFANLTHGKKVYNIINIMYNDIIIRHYNFQDVVNFILHN